MMMLKKLKKGTVVSLAALLLVAAFAIAVGACDKDPVTGGVDKRSLESKIVEANALITGVVAANVATEINTGMFWATQVELTAFEGAITAAEQVKNNPDATQEEVDAALTALTTAMSTFNTARTEGSRTGANIMALTAKINEANTAKEYVETASAATEVFKGTYWVTPVQMTALTTAISTAQGVADNLASTQDQVDAAVTTLNTAIITFNGQKADGSKTVDYSNTLTWGTEFTPTTLGLTPGNDTTEIMLNWYSSGAPASKVAKVRFIEGTKAQGGRLLEATGTVASAASNTSHKAKIEGLRPGTEYQYSVCTDDTNWSPMYNFKTPPASGAFKFAVIADPQLTQGNVDANSRYNVGTTTAAGWLEVMAKIADEGVSFIASGGDQVDAYAGTEAEYNNFFAPPGLRSLPVAPVSGNHDGHLHFTYHYNLPNQQTVSGASYLSNGAALSQTLAEMGNYFYLYNNILFVALSTAPYPQSTAECEPYMTIFRKTLTAATTEHRNKYDWLIVQHHKSTASVGDHLADRDIQYYVEAGFETLMSEFNVDFVLAGHDHVYARSFPLKGMAGGQVSVPDKTNRPAASGSTWTGVQDPIYLTFTTGSGLKYYAVSSDTTTNYNGLTNAPTVYVKNNTAYPYLGESTYVGTEWKSSLLGSAAYIEGALPVSNAAYVQPYIPSYCIVEVNGRTITFKTYPIATVHNDANNQSKPGYASGSTPTFNGSTPFAFDKAVPYDVITVTK